MHGPALLALSRFDVTVHCAFLFRVIVERERERRHFVAVSFYSLTCSDPATFYDVRHSVM